MPALLTGRRILVVEDEYFLAEDVAFALRRLGAEVVGPVGNLGEAEEAVATNAIDGAALDVNIGGRTIYPLVKELQSRDVPFIFMTGYDVSAIPPEYQYAPRCEKPLDPEELASGLATLVRARR
jgi:CheY-like chemotaxis protein